MLKLLPAMATLTALAGSALAQEGAAPPRASPEAIASAVQAEWGKYDTGHKGSLTPLEFGEWVMAANGYGGGKLPPIKILNATSAAFAKADADGDRKVTPEELTRFLQG